MYMLLTVILRENNVVHILLILILILQEIKRRQCSDDNDRGKCRAKERTKTFIAKAMYIAKNIHTLANTCRRFNYFSPYFMRRLYG